MIPEDTQSKERTEMAPTGEAPEQVQEDAPDRDALIDYLSSNFSPDKPAYEPPRTAEQSGKPSK